MIHETNLQLIRSRTQRKVVVTRKLQQKHKMPRKNKNSNPTHPWKQIGPIEMKAGKYYVGDPCYVLGDKAHKELCKMCFPTGNTTGIEGKSVLSDGRIVVSFNCPHGDGVYGDQSGMSYMVDSGWLGITLLEGLEEQWKHPHTHMKEETMTEYIGRLGHIVEYDSEFNVKRVSVDDEVNMTFGDKVTINTGMCFFDTSSGDKW